jgi:hypothetical protein
MNNKTDPNTKHYFQIAQVKEFSDTIHEKLFNAKELKLTLWEKGEDENVAEFYQVTEFDLAEKTIHMAPSGKLLQQIVGSSKIGKEILAKISVDSKTHYFTGGVLIFHKERVTYSLKINQEIFISQQRSNFRLNSNNVIQIKFKIEDEVFHALDLSIGGTSFNITQEESAHYPKGKVFEECVLRFDRKNYHIPKAVVASLQPVLDEAGKKTSQIKVGIAFKDLHHKVADELHVKITVEARGEEMKKKFDAIFAKASS